MNQQATTNEPAKRGAKLFHKGTPIFYGIETP